MALHIDTGHVLVKHLIPLFALHNVEDTEVLLGSVVMSCEAVTPPSITHTHLATDEHPCFRSPSFHQSTQYQVSLNAQGPVFSHHF